MKREYGKKLISLFLTVIMVMSLFCSMAVNAVAAGSTAEGVAEEDEEKVQTFPGFTGCFETGSVDIMNINTILKRTLSFNVGGENITNGEIDGNKGTGVATDWNYWEAKDTNIVYLYNDSYFIDEMSITYTAWAIGAGYNVYFSNDGGETWSKPVITFSATEDKVLYDTGKNNETGKYGDPRAQELVNKLGEAAALEQMNSVNKNIRDNATVEYSINSGKGYVANAIKFEYTGSVKTYKCDLFEIDANGYRQTDCTWDDGRVYENPGCKNNMSLIFKCTICGNEKIEEIEGTSGVLHDWTEISSSVVPATETENGSVTYRCYPCGATKQVDIPALGHNWEVFNTVEPTCGEEGYTVYKCSDDGCELTYKGDYVSATGHVWDDGVVTVLPTLTQNGNKHFTCQKDSSHTRDVALPMATLSDETQLITKDNVVSATETLPEGKESSEAVDVNAIIDGSSSGGFWAGWTGSTATIVLDKEYLIIDGNLYIAGNYVSAKIDFYDSKDVLVTTYETGFVDNGEAVVKQGLTTLLKNGIAVKKIVVTITSDKFEGHMAPKIYELELISHVCKYDGTSRTNIVPSTCDTKGSYMDTCYICGLSRTFETPEEHKYNEEDIVVDKEPNCGIKGIGHAVCTECGRTVNNIEIPEKGAHSLEEIRDYEPNCSNYGYGHYSCSVCGKNLGQYIIKPTGLHMWGEGVEIEAPTTENNGKKEYTCLDCGTKEIKEIPSLAHHFDETVVQPTCTSQGYTLYTCTDDGCDVSYQDNFVRPLGHDWDEGTVTLLPSVSNAGTKVYNCNRGCGAQKTEVIPKLSMSTHTKRITNDNVSKITCTLDEANWKNAHPKYLFDGNNYAGYWDKEGAWYSPEGTSLEIEFDNEYYITSANLYAASNYNTLEINFYDAEGEMVYQYKKAGLDINTGATAETIIPIDLSMLVDKNVKKVVINTVSVKAIDGDSLKIYEIELIAHEHQFDTSASDYTEVVKADCTIKGEIEGTCYVCGKTGHFYTDYHHEYGEVKVVEGSEPTCSKDGVGYYECTKCGLKIENIVIPATGIHNQDTVVVDKESTCVEHGSAHRECSGGCGTKYPSYELELSEHQYSWVLTKDPTFTKKGEQQYICVTCKKVDTDSGIRETNRTESLGSNFIKLDDYSVRYTDFEGLRATFTIKQSDYDKAKGFGHNIKITVNVTCNGVTKSEVIIDTESGKELEDYTYSIVLKGLGYKDKAKFEIVTEIYDENGTCSKKINLTNLQGSGTSIYDVAEKNKSNSRLSVEMRKYYQSIVDNAK